MLKTRSIAVSGLVLFSLLALSGPLNAQDGFPGDKGPDEWSNDLILYLWAVNIDATNTVGPVEVPLDVSFGDIWSKMKFAASAHYEGHKGSWGFLLDGSYVNLGEDGVTVFQGSGPGQVQIDADYRFKIYAGEVAGLWSPYITSSQRLDFLGGIRYTRQKLDLTLTGSGPGEPLDGGFDESWVDPIIGVRWGVGWGQYDRWMFRARTDVGGFGVGSDLAVNVAANFGYRISRTVFVGLGGRYLYTDYMDGTEGTLDYFAFNGDQFGIQLGLGFRF